MNPSLLECTGNRIDIAALAACAALHADAEIERRTGHNIPDIFAQEGEAAFRRYEAETLADVAKQNRQIIACGGVVRDTEYGADIRLRAAFPAGGAEQFVPRLTELSAGSLAMEAAGEEFLPGPRESANGT